MHQVSLSKTRLACGSDRQQPPTCHALLREKRLRLETSIAQGRGTTQKSTNVVTFKGWYSSPKTLDEEGTQLQGILIYFHRLLPLFHGMTYN